MKGYSSWLGKAVSRYSRSLSPDDARSHSKTPRWRTPSPMNASMIPPPIVSSAYAAPSPSLEAPAEESAVDSELLFFKQKQRRLEADLQVLLDAQAEGLLSGLGSKTLEDDVLSTGSSTPTAPSSKLRSTRDGIPSMQRQTKMGLREARRGLHTNMRRLALLKAQEFDHLSPEVEDCEAVVTQLDVWEQKRGRLEERTRQIHEGHEHARAKELRVKADDMQNEINDLEARLAHMKTQQRRLRREATEVENEVKAKLTSYTASLSMLDQQTKDFITDLQMHKGAHTSTRPDPASVTIEATRQAFRHERTQLKRRQASIEKEKEALEEGAIMWKDVVRDVSEFERQLREDMARLGTNKTNGKLREEGTGMVDDNDTSGTPTSDIEGLLAKLDQTTTQLEAKYKYAQTRDWKLLVAAIGAELEAFLKGKDILEAALEASAVDVRLPAERGASELSTQSVYDDFRTPRSSIIHHVDDGEAINDLDQAFEARKSSNTASTTSDTDESDGPDPELLISHQQDTDTE